MPSFIQLFNASYLLNLVDNTVYGMNPSSVGTLNLGPIYSSPFKRGYEPLIARSPQNRQTTMSIQVRGTSNNDLFINLQQLERILKENEDYWESGGIRGDKAWLAVQLGDATNAQLWELISGELDAAQLLVQPILLNQYVMPAVPLKMALKPYGHPQALSRDLSGTLNNGGGTGGTAMTFTQAAPIGEAETPARVTMQPVTATAWQRFIIGRRTRGRVANWIGAFECETGTFTGYAVTNVAGAGFTLSNVAQATAHGGNVLHIVGDAAIHTNTPMIQVAINSNLEDFYGRYQVWVRSFAISAGSVTDLSLTYGGPTGTDIALPSVVPSGMTVGQSTNLGVITIPARAAPLERTQTSFNFQLRASVAANTTFDLDCIYFVPIDEGYVDISLGTLSTNQDQLVLDRMSDFALNTVLANTTGIVQNAVLIPNADIGLWIKPTTPNLWMALLFRDNAGSPTLNLTDTLTLAMDYLPYWNIVR